MCAMTGSTRARRPILPGRSGDDAADLTPIRTRNLGISADVNAVQFGNYGPKVWPSKGLPCSALACSTNWPPLGLVAGCRDRHLQPNSHGALALPLPMHSTSGVCSA